MEDTSAHRLPFSEFDVRLHQEHCSLMEANFVSLFAFSNFLPCPFILPTPSSLVFGLRFAPADSQLTQVLSHNLLHFFCSVEQFQPLVEEQKTYQSRLSEVGRSFYHAKVTLVEQLYVSLFAFTNILLRPFILPTPSSLSLRASLRSDKSLLAPGAKVFYLCP
jgi:hypothetical protein